MVSKQWRQMFFEATRKAEAAKRIRKGTKRQKQTGACKERMDARYLRT